MHKIAQEVKDLLISVDGIEVKIINDRIIIDGEIVVPSNFHRIRAVVSQYSERLVQSLVTLSPEAQNKIVELIQKEIARPKVSVEARNNAIILAGEVSFC